MSAPTRKAQLRAQVHARLSTMPAAARSAGSQAVGEHLDNLRLVRDAEAVFTYVSNDDEVDTRALIQRWLAQGKTVAVPRVESAGRMSAHRITGLDPLRPGRFGLLTPIHDDPLPAPASLCIAPCLAVTQRGDRLGRGGGHYDRYLAAQADESGSVNVLVLAFDEQLVESLPVEPHDIAADFVVTPAGVIRCSEM